MATPGEALAPLSGYLTGLEDQVRALTAVGAAHAERLSTLEGNVQQLLNGQAALVASQRVQDDRLTALDQRVAALEDGGGVPVPPDPGPENTYLPKSYPSLQAYLDAGYGPKDARTADAKMANGAPVYVFWSQPGTRPWQEFSMEDQFRLMQDGQVLVLPERPEPYIIDCSAGFIAAGVDHIHDTSLPAGAQDVKIPNQYKGKSPRTWFAMTRMRRGILGLGPGAVVDESPSSYTRPPQGDEDQLTWISTDGSSHQVNGCQERLIDVAAKEDAYIGNFTFRGRGAAFGGVAYSGIGMKVATVERMDFDGSWSGFAHAPNGETGAFSCDTHTVRNTTFHCAKSNNPKTSVMMANNCGSSSLTDVQILDSVGSVTYWNSDPGAVATWRNVISPGSVNMEANHENFVLDWQGGSVGGGGYNINLRSPYGSQKVTLKNVRNTANNPLKLIFNIWGQPPYTQSKADCKWLDANGNALPVLVAGNSVP